MGQKGASGDLTGPFYTGLAVEQDLIELIRRSIHSQKCSHGLKY